LAKDNHVTSFQAPKGTYDVIPPASADFTAVIDGLTAPAKRAGYGYIQTPIFEDTALFTRSVGASTDVVTKEMYTFVDRGDRSLTLRPEGTAGVLRAVIEHGLYRGPLPLKLWYTGPNFRYEQPQSGRYRQHVQVGVEAIGSDDPALDAEVVWLADEGYRGLGLTDFELRLNSLGDEQCRPAYRSLLQEFLRSIDLDDDTRKRVEINPLRVLDDKRADVQAQLVDAPLLIDHLCADCKEHYDNVRSFLTDLSVRWVDDPRLVRGLDYYTRTTFEFVHNRLRAQSGIGGGGRYDGLLETLGGPALGGIGFGLGVDRTVLALRAEGVALGSPARVQIFVVPLGEEPRHVVVRLLADLRRMGIATDMAYGDRGIKGAMRAADRSGAKYAVVVGERDLNAGVVQVKDMASGDQVAVPQADVVTYLAGRLS
jgi:histidyl-tRNA synthetase